MRDAFQSLAADALNSNRSAFLDLAKASFEGFQKEAALQFDSRQKAIDGLVQPIADTLKKVDVKLGEAERERIDAYARLTEKVSALGSTADSLSRALRTPAVRGTLGRDAAAEGRRDRGHAAALRLRRTAAAARRQRPAPARSDRPSSRRQADRRRREVAARGVSRCAGCCGRRTRDAQASRRTRVRCAITWTGSAARVYWEALATSPEFVVMFLPGETLFSAALQHDRSPDRARLEPAGAAGEPDYADRAAHHRRPLVAAGSVD